MIYSGLKLYMHNLCSEIITAELGYLAYWFAVTDLLFKKPSDVKSEMQVGQKHSADYHSAHTGQTVKYQKQSPQLSFEG